MPDLEPHDYWPSYQHMGDCVHCGNHEESPIHTNRKSQPEYVAAELFRFAMKQIDN